MGKKRKAGDSEDVQKSTPVEVIVEDVSSHPLCLHGPTILFSSEKGRYFACSSCRNKKDCTVHIDEEDWQKEGVKKRNEKYYNLIPKINKAAAWTHMNEIKSRHFTDRAYCATCDELYLISTNRKHVKDHRVFLGLTDEQLTKPSWLPPIENDAVEAQYLFNKKTIGTVFNILRNNNISNILCIGTPSLHYAASAQDFTSLLLDYDTRHRHFNHPSKYIWYNMFNNYMFDGDRDEKVLKAFFKKAKGGICILMDPPFGGRVEPLANTLQQLTHTYNSVCDTNTELLPVMWAFPYFSEPYIVNLLDGVKMHDFQVEYDNHKKFVNKKSGRKHGSPIRFFTNLPFATIDLSNDSSYKFCDKCKFWVASANSHCNKCKECTSKNGMTYKHCNTCKRCVKPTFKHCEQCERCVLEKGHRCGVVVESQSCFNCREKDHKRSQCPKLEHDSSKKKRKHA